MKLCVARASLLQRSPTTTFPGKQYYQDNQPKPKQSTTHGQSTKTRETNQFGSITQTPTKQIPINYTTPTKHPTPTNQTLTNQTLTNQANTKHSPPLPQTQNPTHSAPIKHPNHCLFNTSKTINWSPGSFPTTCRLAYKQK